MTTNMEFVIAGVKIAWALNRPLMIAGEPVHVPDDVGRALWPDGEKLTRAAPGEVKAGDIDGPMAIRDLARRCLYCMSVAGQEITRLGIDLGALGGSTGKIPMTTPGVPGKGIPARELASPTTEPDFASENFSTGSEEASNHVNPNMESFV